MVQVLFVNIEGRVSGAENSLLLLAKSLPSEYSVSTACPGKGGLLSEMGDLGVRCFALPSMAGWRRFTARWLLGWLRINCRLLKILLRVRPDVIHANSFYSLVFLILPTLLSGGRLICHGRDFSRFAIFVKLCSWRCHRVIAVSQAVKDNLIGQGVNPDKIDVVYNGVEVEDVDKERFKDDCHKKAPVFAHVGQFVPWKKQKLFLEAAALVVRELPGSKFMLVGDDIFGRNPEYKDEIFQTIQRLGISKNVVFSGWQEDMDKVWDRISCLVHTADREPFGRVVIEAMARGILVIAVGRCGPREIMEDRKTGLLVEPDNVEQLSEAMLKVVREPKKARAIAINGYRHVMNNFSAQKTAECVARIYEDVMSGCNS